MPAGWVAAAAAVVGAGVQASSAEDAEDAQYAANQEAMKRGDAQYAQARADTANSRAAGNSALSQITYGLGLDGSTGGGAGRFNKRFTIADFLEDPVIKLGYESGLENGTKAIGRMAGARGNINSGANLKALTRFTTDYTGQKAGESQARFYGDQDREYNRLAGVAGTGQVATQNINALGAQHSLNIGNLLTGQGNARGAAAIAQGNAWGQAANSIGNWYGQNQMMDKYLANQNTRR